METLPQKLLEYVTSDGRNPFNNWLCGLRDYAARGRIRVRLNRLRLGNFGDSKSLRDGVFELRITFGPGYRIYYAKVESSVVLLLIGGDKSTQMTDVRLAKRFWLDFKRRIS